MSLPESQPSWFDSSETGAPTLNNVTGSMLEILRACLKNGFNPKSVTSIVVAAGVATATAATHGYTNAVGKLVLIEGSGEALLNGRKQPISVATNTFTFAAPGVADGTYTGTITAKRAPLGWDEAHTGTNVAIFERTAPESTALLLRINDSAAAGASATNARVLMIESATDVDTYSGESPQEVHFSGGQYWYKGTNNATAKQWAIVGDDRFFWFIHPAGSGTAPYNLQVSYFGDGVEYVTPAPYDCLLCGAIDANSASSLRGGAVNTNYSSVTESYAEVVARGLDGTTRGVRVGKSGPGVSLIGASNGLQVVSTPVVVHRPSLYSANDLGVSPGRFRGEMPGLAMPLARAPFVSLGQFAVVETDVGEVRKYLSVLFTIGSSQNGNLLLDLTGPWR